MYSRFSERLGYKPKKEFLQKDSIDLPLRNALWNVFYEQILLNLPKKFKPLSTAGRRGIYLLDGWGAEFVKKLEMEFFHSRVNEISYISNENFKKLERFFVESIWYEVYDVLEFTLNESSVVHKLLYTVDLVQSFNKALENHLSAYRVLGNKFVPIVDDSETEAIDEAVALKDYPAQHLSMALEKLADRQNPDYRNSIKESISAVESICREITNESTLDRALKKIQTKIDMNDQFKQGLEKLYHYTNAESGVRHALLEDSKASFDEAKFMLVTCSAFVNYLRAKLPKIEE